MDYFRELQIDRWTKGGDGITVHELGGGESGGCEESLELTKQVRDRPSFAVATTLADTWSGAGPRVHDGARPERQV
jgi:hypothetical protein